jgi:hypothetical protein
MNSRIRILICEFVAEGLEAVSRYPLQSFYRRFDRLSDNKKDFRCYRG